MVWYSHLLKDFPQFIVNSNQLKTLWGLLGSSVGKESACSVGKPCSIPGLGRSPGEENGSSILSWRIPWTEEPGGLQSMGSQRVGHD